MRSQPKTNLWPCDPIHHPGSEFWYCEDGPGWKPPQELIDRERRERQEVEQALQEQRSTDPAADAAVGTGVPSPSSNVFEMLWVAAPVTKGAKKGTVQLDLSALGERTQLHSVRYAWPLGGDGDTCCPGLDAQVRVDPGSPAVPCYGLYWHRVLTANSFH